ncbi:MAG: Gfo/Idh/MocA family protein [Flavobacteriales bacterium]
MSAPFYRSRPDHLVALPQEKASTIDRWHPERRTQRSRSENWLRKAIFFLFREGPLRSWRKYRARKLKEKLEGTPVCLILRDKENGTYYGGFQHRIEQECYYFLPGACWEQEPERAKLNPIEKLDPFLGHVPEGFEGANTQRPFRAIRFRSPDNAPQKEFDLYAVGCGSYMLSEVLPVYLKAADLAAAIDIDRSVLELPELKKARQRSNDLGTAIEGEERPERPKIAYIASYHSWHSAQALDMLDAFPNARVIVEKPPCITETDLRMLWWNFDPERIFIAFHRRYAPMNRWIREWIGGMEGAVLVNMEIHETPIGPDHWYFAPDQGTRIAGNLCHWIDLALFWIRSEPYRVSVAANEKLGPDASFYTLHFEDGSMVHFTATDRGDPTYGVQERIRVLGEEEEIRLEDGLRVQRWHRGRWKGYRKLLRDKGHERMNRDHLERIRAGKASPYPADALLKVTRIQNAFIHLVRNGGGSMPLDLRRPEEMPDLSSHAEAGPGS